ncbi:ABC bile acid transporter [Bisporella sp. PMI_857]|nr:ABC bile acid transporter [Bisporella sp. PMI_857]
MNVELTAVSAVSSVSFVLIALSTIPSVWRLAKHTRHVGAANETALYEDEDGVATEESMARFNTKWHFRGIFAVVGAGLITSLGTAIAVAVRKNVGYPDLALAQLWLLFPSWIFLLLQIIDTSLVSNCVLRFERGAFNLFSAVLIAILAWTPLIGDIPAFFDNIILPTLATTQIAEAATVAVVLFCIERRPDVYRNGHLVERQFQGSLWSRYTYSWAEHILDEAAAKNIDAKELPALDATASAKDVGEKFKNMALKPSTALWKLIFWRLRWTLIWQWIVIAFSCFFDVGPEFAMLRILQYLEARRDFEAPDARAWLWVGAMLLITVGSTIIDHRVMWSMIADVAIPIRSTLTTLLFEKVVRLKDVGEATDAVEKKGEGATADGVDKAQSSEAPEPDKTNKPTRQTQQDVVNIFAVDTNMVAMFAANQQMYINFAFRVFILGRRYAAYQQALMKARDEKTTIITEVLNGIRQIKFSATEEQWFRKIKDVRENELRTLWQAKLATVIMGLASDLTPVLFAVFTLSSYSYFEGDLIPSVAFTAISLFIQMEGLTNMLPYLMTLGVNAKVSCDRIDKYLNAPEREQTTFPGESVGFHNATISFPTNSKDETEERFIMRDITLEFPSEELSVISGPIGAGKSLLLAAILGESELLSGYITVPRPPSLDARFDSKANADNWILPSAIAYIAQTPWIENATIKNNILFGLPEDPVRYEKVIKACALTKDLAMFDDRDQTEVGAQGISLSGGQKWRLTLARAFYSRAGILIMDDIFSALDAHVGKEIYDNALMGELSIGRTRILVTHHVSLCLPRAKYAVRLGAQGTLEHAGFVTELKQSRSFDDILNAEDAEVRGETRSSPDLASSGTTLRDEAQGSIVVLEDVPTVPKSTPKKLVEDEKRETGRVKRNVYTGYLSSTGGIPFWGFVIIVYFVAQGLAMSRSWWVKIWTSSYEHSHGQIMVQNATLLPSYGHTFQTQFLAHPKVSTFLSPKPSSSESNLLYYLGIYVGISLILIVVVAFRSYFVYRGALTGSRKLFEDMTYSVLRTPLRWLDTVPTGRILNRFTADFQNIDSTLGLYFGIFCSAILGLIGIWVTGAIISPYMLISSIFLLGSCVYMTRRYLNGARTIKRLESIQKSPMISHFSSSLEGLSTIRAFGNAPVFVDRMYVLIDAFADSTWHNWLFSNWIGFRMAIVGSCFSSIVAAFIVSTNGIDASLAGFALAFALDYRGAAMRIIRLVANIELDMNAAERVFEYCNIDMENQGGIDNLRASWPEEGKLEVTDLEVGYAEGLPSILKGLTFKADSNQRIGVVGRTGAGKSTLSLALFRFLEARKGSIIIDEIDISTIKLHDLRTRLAIIPQDPVLFSGPIRSNLDPFDEFSDYQIKEVLARVHLTPSVDNTPTPEPLVDASEAVNESETTTIISDNGNANIFLDLSSPISSGGTNLSQGQKQLLCLARAILSRPRVLILDEATSAVDMSTDALIQRSIREEFANTTLLVVAHRLSTVADFDRILVMRDGVAAEFGSPKELLQTEDGVFKGMVGQSGQREELEKTILGL